MPAASSQPGRGSVTALRWVATTSATAVPQPTTTQTAAWKPAVGSVR